MLLAEKIELFFNQVDMMTDTWEDMTPIARRMYAMGFMNELYQIVTQLEDINEQLDSSLGFEDAYLDYAWNDEARYRTGRLLDERMYREEPTKDTEINRLIDFFPKDKETYSFTSEKADTLKTGMRYLCSEGNVSPRDIVFALDCGIKKVWGLLDSIKKKKAKIKDFQWEDFWYGFLLRDDDLYFERAQNDYDKWKEEHDWHDFQTLKDKRTQEILKVLKSGVFSHDVVPVKRDIAKSIITIEEDAIEDGEEIPDNIPTECARMSKYVTMKEDILCLDYVKLGKYVYKHYSQLEEDEENSLIYFDIILCKIHEDMAECKPKLKKYLKNNEDEVLEEILNKALTVINSCSVLLKEGVGQDFLSDYLREAFYGDTKAEVQAKLKGQSKHTILCEMLGMLRTTQKVFKIDTAANDLATALSEVVKKPNKESLTKYINNGSAIRKSKLSEWTTNYVMEKLGSETDRAFINVSKDSPLK